MIPPRPAVLLDRDGTLIVERGYLSDPAGVELETGAVEGLARLVAAGFVPVVLTNQSGIARGYFDRAAADAVNRRTGELLTNGGVAIQGWYVCPHGPGDGCHCRKPSPGLAYQAADALDLDLSRSWMIGDKRSDIELARAVGASGLLVLTGHGAQDREWAENEGVAVAASLTEAADIILSASVQPE